MGKSKDLASGAAYQDQTESDTRYVNTAGDTMTGNLTLGSTSTSQPILQMLSSTSGANTIHFGDAASGADSYKGYINYAHNTDQIQFAVNGAVRQIIDSAGRVTMPYQPSFFARHTTATTYNSAYVVNWNSITYNVGNHFVGSTGTFTAPVSGVYQLNSMLGNNYANGAGNYMVKLNGSDYHGLVWDPYNGQTSWSTSILVGQMKLAPNDTVRIYCNSTGNPDNSSWTSWSMCLLG